MTLLDPQETFTGFPYGIIPGLFVQLMDNNLGKKDGLGENISPK
jgi:hypothetical protein